MQDAACIGADTALFFAAEDEKPRARRMREARARSVCAGCAVRESCLEFRLSADPPQQDGGIFGGLDGEERAQLRHALVKRWQRGTGAA